MTERVDLFRSSPFSVVATSPWAFSEPTRTLDVSKLPGAKLVGAVEFFGADAEGIGGCVRAGSERYLRGLEAVVFEKASYGLLKSLGIAPIEQRFELEPDRDRIMRRTHSGMTERGPFLIQHQLNFLEDGDLLLCSTACIGRACEALSLETEGLGAEPPRPGLFMRALEQAIEAPWTALGAVSIAGAAILAILIARRDRREPREQAGRGDPPDQNGISSSAP